MSADQTRTGEAGTVQKGRRRGRALVLQTFVSIVAVSLISVAATGLVTRLQLSSSFAVYLEQLGRAMTPGRGMAARLLGTQEQAFLDAVDQGIILSIAIAIAIAAVVALLLARRLSRPLRRLTLGARAFAAGDLGHRVPVEGPSEVADLAVAFNDMADSVSHAEELRRRMVADVAHELRNPIAALRAQTEALTEGVFEFDTARAESLAEDVSHLSRLVEDLQELSLAEAGQLRYDLQQMDLRALLSREVERAAALAHEGVEMTAQLPSMALVVMADEFRVSQVLRNLLGNAVRHTASGGITLNAHVVNSDVIVEVIDTGEGIPEADLPYVFERFYRADTSRGANTGGAGIGLAISRRIVEDHGGTMFARSERGEGATVGFRIPMSDLGGEQSG